MRYALIVAGVLGLLAPLAPLAASATTPITPGVTASSVTIAATVPLSGFQARESTASAAAAAVFKYINAHGGVNGRKVNFLRSDDCMNLAAYGLNCALPIAATTLSQTKSVLQSGVFAMVGSVGTGAQDSVLSLLNSSSVPQLFVDSGSTDWNQPTKYPSTFGFASSYKSEGKIYANYIKAHYKGMKVGFIGQQTMLGTATFDTVGSSVFTGLTTSTGVSVAKIDHRTYTPFDALGGANDIVPSIAQLQSDAVKVVVLASTPQVTAAILSAAHSAGFSPHWVITTSGSDPVQVDSSLEPGAITLSSFPATSDTTNVWNVWLRKVLAADHADVPSYKSTAPLDPRWQYGAAYAVTFLEALKTAGAHPTRAGLLSALKSTVFQTPAILPLHFTSSNHQGFDGGVIASVAAHPVDTQALPTKVVYMTSSAASTTVSTAVHYTVAPIPAWLK